MSRLFRIFVGSAPPDDAGGVLKTSQGVPVIGGMDSSNGSKVYFDREGNYLLEASKNLFIKGKEVFEELEKRNVIIVDSEAITALSISLNALEKLILSGDKIEVFGEELKVSVDGTAEFIAPKITLGKINSEVLYGEADGTVYGDDEQLYNENSVPDPLMTKRKFSTWWGKIISKLLEDIDELKNKYNDLASKYNSHKHLETGTSTEKPTSSVAESVSIDFAGHTAKNVSNMQASKTTSAI